MTPLRTIQLAEAEVTPAVELDIERLYQDKKAKVQEVEKVLAELLEGFVSILDATANEESGRIPDSLAVQVMVECDLVTARLVARKLRSVCSSKLWKITFDNHSRKRYDFLFQRRRKKR